MRLLRRRELGGVQAVAREFWEAATSG